MIGNWTWILDIQFPSFNMHHIDSPSAVTIPWKCVFSLAISQKCKMIVLRFDAILVILQP